MRKKRQTMGKRFIKFRMFRAIPTFQSCRSKESSSAIPANPVPSIFRLSPSLSAHKSAHQPPSNSKPHHRSASSIKRHVSSAFASARRSFFREDSRTQLSSSSRFRWGKDPKWHIMAKIPECNDNVHSTPPRRKIYNSAEENDVVLFPPLTLKNRRRFRAARRKIRISTSSDSGLFSEDDERENDEDEYDDQEEETDALVSTDSSTPRPSNASKVIQLRKKKKKRRSPFKMAAEEDVSLMPARLSEFMRKMAPCRAVEGKMRESFAVVKKSDDPYEDFKRSMVEMVVEKQMFEAAELEELLRCFLSLNSANHHEAIVRAFAEIWEALFCDQSS